MIEQLTSTEIEFIRRLAHQILTQDNYGTADPVYCVQEQIEIWGVDTAYGGELEACVDGDNDENEEEMVGVKREWVTCETFLSRKAALEHIGPSKRLRLYVESAHRNYEMRMLRAILPKLANLNYPLPVLPKLMQLPAIVIEPSPV